MTSTGQTIIAASASLLLLTGCVSAAKSVVTAPFKAAGKVADWTTTSQEEADRNRGRKMRERDEQLEKLQKDQRKAAKKCSNGDQRQCERAQILSQEMDAIMNAPL